MLIPPRVIYYPLNELALVETSRWCYYESIGLFGTIKVDFGNDKFSWTPTIEYVKQKAVPYAGLFTIPLFRYDASRKNTKPQFKWTKRQTECFLSETSRPYDLIGYFDIRYAYDRIPFISFNPWERKPWQSR